MHLLSLSFLATQISLFAQATPGPIVAPSGTLSGGLIYTVLIGLVVGVIAKLLTPGRDPGGCIITSLIGIAGAFLAYFVGGLFGVYGNGKTPGIIVSIIGAVVVLAIYHAVIGRRGGGTPAA